MKKIYVLGPLVFWFFKMQAQNCAYTPLVDSLFRESAENIVINEIRVDTNHLFYDSVSIPQHEVADVLGLINSVYTQANSIEFQEIFENANWNFNSSGSPYTPSGNESIAIVVDTSTYWVDTLVLYQNYSGNLSFDSLFNYYDLELVDYYSFSNFNVIQLSSSIRYQYLNFIPIFEHLDSIVEVYSEGYAFIPEGCFFNYSLVSSSLGDTLTFKIENDFSPFSSSSYWQYFIDTNCVATLVSKSVGVCPAVGIKDLENIAKIYPNPAKNYLFIDMAISSSNRYSIYNVLGEEMMEEKFQNLKSSFQINVSNLVKGIYFIEINTSIFKFIKD